MVKGQKLGVFKQLFLGYWDILLIVWTKDLCNNRKIVKKCHRSWILKELSHKEAVVYLQKNPARRGVLSDMKTRISIIIPYRAGKVFHTSVILFQDIEQGIFNDLVIL